MFVAGTPAEKAATLRRIEAGGSVLDLVLDKKGRLERAVAAEDRARLDQYFSSVRELARSRAWEDRAKPAVDYPEPDDIADATRVIEKSRLMFDLARLALETDSTRVITLSLSTFSVVPHVPGVKTETHSLTHHGNEPEKIAELRRIEEAQMQAFAGFLASLRGSIEAGQPLLDHTQVLYGSCLGNANSHSTENLPIIESWPPESHRRLFGDLPIAAWPESAAAKPPAREAIRQTPLYEPAFQSLSARDRQPPLETVQSTSPTAGDSRVWTT